MKSIRFLFMFIALYSFCNKVNGQIDNRSQQETIYLKNMETLLDSLNRDNVFEYLQKFGFSERKFGGETDIYMDTLTNREFRVVNYDDKIQNVELWTKNAKDYRNIRSALENGYRPLSSSTYKDVYTSSFYSNHYYFRVLIITQEEGSTFIMNLVNKDAPMRRTMY